MTTHILPMTYQPKIEGVFDGDMDQTIRVVASDVPWEIGDDLYLHTWAGKPYRSPWGRRLDTWVKELRYIYARKDEGWFRANGPWEKSESDDKLGEPYLDDLALRDGIMPPNASTLVNVLMDLNKLTPHNLSDVMFRIIRWPRKKDRLDSGHKVVR